MEDACIIVLINHSQLILLNAINFNKANQEMRAFQFQSHIPTHNKSKMGKRKSRYRDIWIWTLLRNLYGVGYGSLLFSSINLYFPTNALWCSRVQTHSFRLEILYVCKSIRVCERMRYYAQLIFSIQIKYLFAFLTSCQYTFYVDLHLIEIKTWNPDNEKEWERNCFEWQIERDHHLRMYW